MEEVWKDIEGFEGFYQVSSFGNVRRIGSTDSINRERSIGNLRLSKNRYVTVNLCKNGVRTLLSCHKLVAATFLPTPPCCPTCKTPYEINHKDENPYNNRADNLEYTTHVENVHRSSKKSQKGRRKILTDESVTELKQLIVDGIKYPTIASKFNVSVSSVSDIANGRMWKHIPFPPS